MQNLRPCSESLHPQYTLYVKGRLIAKYKPDFRYVEARQNIIVDVKSAATAKRRDFVLIKKLMAACCVEIAIVT